MTYLSVAMMGTDAERAAYRDAVNGQHRQIRSAPGAPVKYNAFDRNLQLWVAACLYYGLLDFHQRLNGPLDDDTADWLYAQSARFGTTLQVRPEDWPADREAFDAYWKEGLAQISYAEPIKEYLLAALDLGHLPEKQRAKHAGFHRWVNTGFLPAEVREELGLEWSDQDAARHARLMARTGQKTRARPRVMRMFPYNYFLLDFRVRRTLRRPSYSRAARADGRRDRRWCTPHRLRHGQQTARARRERTEPFPTSTCFATSHRERRTRTRTRDPAHGCRR